MRHCGHEVILETTELDLPAERAPHHHTQGHGQHHHIDGCPKIQTSLLLGQLSKNALTKHQVHSPAFKSASQGDRVELGALGRG